MTRRELRENVFKMLFRVEFFDAGELSEQLVLFGEEVDHVTDNHGTGRNHNKSVPN